MEMVTLTYSRRVHLSDKPQGIIRIDFAAVDTKGRTFGAQAFCFSCEFERKTGEVAAYAAARFDQREPGTWYGYRPHATRGGKLYGASQGERLFATEAERDAAAERYLREAGERAIKNKARAA